jgi:SPP1 family predicted phage head-tail adaptor
MSKLENIGKLDRRITFQKKIFASNVSNEDEEAGWVNIGVNPTVWASKNEKLGSESYRADKLVDYNTIHFVCRYRDDITAEYRVVCEDIAYDIVSPPVEIGRKRFLSIECESGGDFVGEILIESGFTSGFAPGFR